MTVEAGIYANTIPEESKSQNTLANVPLNDVITKHLSHFFNKLKPVIDSYGGRMKLPAGIILTGGLSNLCGIDSLASSIFNIPTKVSPLSGFEDLHDLADQPSYSTAIGIAVKETLRLTRENNFGKLEKCRNNFANWIEKVA